MTKLMSGMQITFLPLDANASLLLEFCSDANLDLPILAHIQLCRTMVFLPPSWVS